MKIFEKSKWIWANVEACSDQYTEYKDYVGAVSQRAIIRLSCDSDYTLYINGRYIASNQYGDFEHYKIYDEIDITEYLNKDKNEIHFLVYYCGEPFQRYKPASAGLIYEVVAGNDVVAYSSEAVLSRLNPAYSNGLKRLLTSQLGFTFAYDSTKENEEGYNPSKIVDKRVSFFKRPIKKQVVLERVIPKSIKKISNTHYLVDLGKEYVGLPTLKINAKEEGRIEIAFGEHIADGGVRKIKWDRHFYYEYFAKTGENIFTNYMLRLGCRYLEVLSQTPIEIDYVSVLPQVYEVNKKGYSFDNKLDEQIYNMCVNTLNLCMMEHYVDTPWREQCLYAFDSRNQILCGYNAFENGNIDYVKANLRLFVEDKREDGLLSICSPCGTDLAIPSFSLYFVMTVYEYLEFSQDIEFARLCVPKIQGIIDEFLSRERDGLIQKFTGNLMWNFYDWSPYLDGELYSSEKARPDLILNCLTIMVLDFYEKICKITNIPFGYKGVAQRIKDAARKAFFKTNAFEMHKGTEQFTVLGNSLAILSGVADEDIQDKICQQILNKELVDCSLSMKVFKYQALLQVNQGKYGDFVLSEIRNEYQKMLDGESGAVWETAEGQSAFDNAGSLCHGWSAIPVYFYHKLGIAK